MVVERVQGEHGKSPERVPKKVSRRAFVDCTPSIFQQMI